MNAPQQPPPQPAPPGNLHQYPLSEAVEQAADTARQWIADAQRFGEQEADALAERRYGLSELATAPVRLYGLLVANLINTARTASDNLVLLSLSGRFGAATAERAVRVHVDAAGAAPRVLRCSDLLGQQYGYCIQAVRITVQDSTWATEGIVTIRVPCAGAPPDTYAGKLVSVPGHTPAVSEDVLVAIDEIGVPVT